MTDRQQGFALIAAIVLVGVLAGLAAFAASMLGTQGALGQLERSGRVVDLAARSGLEWGAHRVMRAAVPACTPLTVLPALAAYPGVRITVACAATPTTEPLLPGPGTVTVYRITATATIGTGPASPDYAERAHVGLFSR